MSDAPFNTHMARRDYGTIKYRSLGHWKGPEHRSCQDVILAQDAAVFEKPVFLMLDAASGHFVRWDGSTDKTLAVLELPADATTGPVRASVTMNGDLAYEGMVEADWEFPAAITNAATLRAALITSRFDCGVLDREYAA